MYGNFGIDANLANLTYLGWSWSDSVVMAIIDKYIGYVICPEVGLTGTLDLNFNQLFLCRVSKHRHGRRVSASRNKVSI